MKTLLLPALALLGLTAWCAAGGEQKPFDLTTALGETFHNCRILKALPDGITIVHEIGVTKIPFENLNDEWKTQFHYSPEKARAFQAEEAERRAAAEAKQRELRMNYEKYQESRISLFAAAERRRIRLEEEYAQQQADAAAAAAAAAVTQPGVLMPLPGDPTPYLGGVAPAGAADPGLVPPMAPITQIYTPGATNGQHYIISQDSIYTPGDGSLYSISPGYYPGYYSGYVRPPLFGCPPHTNQNHFHFHQHGGGGPGNIHLGPGNIHFGPGTLHLGRH